MNLYCFDFFGAYLGYMNDNGDVFDSRGCKWAHVGDRDKVYDLNGKLCGHIDSQGNFFTEHAVCRGYLRNWNDAAGVRRLRAAGASAADRR